MRVNISLSDSDGKKLIACANNERVAVGTCARSLLVRGIESYISGAPDRAGMQGFEQLKLFLPKKKG